MNFIPYLLVMGILNKNKVKKMVFRCSIILFSVVWLLITPSNKAKAAKLDPIDWLNYIVEISGAYMDQYFSMVHYNVQWNDFWWWILWLPVEQITWDAVEISIPTEDGTDSRFCSSKVRGFYWNSQRWDNRLWPLDDVTHSWLVKANPDKEKYAWLTISWWWYTTCSEDRSTVELNTYLENNSINISLSDLAKIVAVLQKYDREQWPNYIDEALSWYRLSDWVAKDRIKSAILSWASFEIDPYWIYWRIMHNYWWWQKIDLIAWASYDMVQNRISTWHLTCSLQRLSNNYPFGYVYDDYGHIGMVWARISSDYIQWAESRRAIAMDFHSWLNFLLNSWWPDKKWICMNQIFWFDWKDMKLIKQEMSERGWAYDIPWRSDNDTWNTIGKVLSNFLNAWNGTARTTVFSLWIKGIVWLTDEVRDSQKEYFENNQLQSTLMLRTETSISNIVNSVSRNAERICRWKWSTSAFNIVGNTDDVICLSWDAATQWISWTPKQMSWKTIVVKNADLAIDMRNPAMYQWNDDVINLFIDKWNMLLITSGVDVGNLVSFDEYWYLAQESEIKAMFLKGNFVVNWLILWGLDWKGIINNRLYMHGKVISYNTITVPTASRKKTIATIMSDRNWTTEDVPEWISLTKLFGWSCDAVSWIGTDGTSCKWSSSVWKESQLVDKAFWLIDMDISSDLVSY